MSASDSFLMQDGYHYHMVVATSQATVSSTIYEWLRKLPQQNYSEAYLWKEEDATATKVTPTLLKEETGADIFSIPHDTSATSPVIEKLIQKGFLCAFTAEPSFKGAPASEKRPLKPGPIEFRQEGTHVHFNLICRSFSIVALIKRGNGSWQWINIKQQLNTPWTIDLDVPLSMQKTKVPKLLKQVAPYTNNLAGNSIDMFSIKKLIMNFTDATLYSLPSIAELNPSEGIKTNVSLARVQHLLSAFAAALVQDLGKRAEAMIGFSLVADKPLDTGKGSLVPTDASFYISAHKDKNGNPTNQYQFYTLNYLLMTMGMAMPAPRAFSWNWINPDKPSGGVIAINRGVFALYLKDQLKESLKEIIKRPQLTITARGGSGNVEITNTFVNEPSQPELIPLYTEFSPVITARCDYNNTTEASYPVTIRYQPLTLKAALAYEVMIFVKFNDSELIFDYGLRTFYNLEITEGEIKELFLFCTKGAARAYTIGVNTKGELALTLKETRNETSDYPIFPEKILRMYGGSAVQLRSALVTAMTNMLTAEHNKMIHVINQGVNWVFPGTDTFTFSNCYFSAKEDLITEINYAAIS